MQIVHPDGFFVKVMDGKPVNMAYRIVVQNHEGHSWEFVDPYRFGPVLTEFDLHLLAEGTHYKSYEKLGAHVITHEARQGGPFRGVGTQCATSERVGQLQPLGWSPPPDA